METKETAYPQSGSLIDQEELKSFYKTGLPQILKRMLAEPISGTYRLFSDTSAKSYFHSLVLMASTFVVYVVLTYLLSGTELREVIGFGGAVKIGLGAVIFMLVVSIVVFGLKAISGKPQFKNELLTGGLCSIPMIILLILVFMVKLFAGEEATATLTADPAAIITKAGVMLLLMFYVLLMMINIVQQSLKASGTKDAWAWYMSPAVIFLSAYISFKISVNLF